MISADHYFNCGKWQEVAGATNIQQIAASKLGESFFALDESGSLWRKRKNQQGTEPLDRVDSQPLKNIAVGKHFFWGGTRDDQLVRRDLDFNEPWTSYKAKKKKVKWISAGTGEIWLVTTEGEVYRMPEHGGDFLEFVSSGMEKVAVGRGFVWLVNKNGKVSFARLEGFASKKIKKALELE